MPKLANSRARRTKKPAATKSTNGKSATVRPGTKQTLLIDLLKRKNGVTIAEAVNALGWQPRPSDDTKLPFGTGAEWGNFLISHGQDLPGRKPTARHKFDRWRPEDPAGHELS